MERNVNTRRRGEKLLILVLALAAVGLIWLELAFDPLSTANEQLRARISGTERQIAAQQTAYASMLAASQEDPNKFANDRLLVIQREQSLLEDQIGDLAGDLVTPNQMTQILTTVLEQQSGLQLVTFRNEEAQPLRVGLANTAQALAQTGAVNLEQTLERNISGQVYEHGLIIEFEGDFFSTLRYLRFLEEITGSFFWDEITYRQLEWPNASVTLEIHTLSTDQGFMGV